MFSSAAVALVGGVARDQAVGQRDRVGGEDASALEGDAGGSGEQVGVILLLVRISGPPGGPPLADSSTAKMPPPCAVPVSPLASPGSR